MKGFVAGRRKATLVVGRKTFGKLFILKPSRKEQKFMTTPLPQRKGKKDGKKEGKHTLSCLC